MGRFTATEAREYQALRTACHQGLGAMELLAFLSERLQGLIGADAFCANELNPKSTLLTRAVSQGWPDEAKHLLVERVFLASPIADPPRLLDAGWRAVDVDALVAHLDKPLQDPYFQHHLLPFGYRYEALLLCTLKGSGHGLLTFSRKPQQGHYEERQLRLLNALAPHIAAGIAKGNLREAIAMQRESRLGVLVLDDRGELELANTVGEDWLRADSQGRWSLGLPLVAALLSRSASEKESFLAPFFELSHPTSGAIYRVFWERGDGQDGRPRTIMFLEPVQRLDYPEALLRLGLTPREADVTLALVRGLSAKAISAQLGLSLHTVTQHTKSVFSKLGVSSRGELAALLMGVARLPNGEDH